MCVDTTSSSCQKKEVFDTVMTGKINRLTGELSASQYYFHKQEGGRLIEKDSWLDEWHMTCTMTDRRF
jgi:hypothetical protein